MRIGRLLPALAAAVVLSVSPLQAKDDDITTLSPKQMAEIMQQAGYRAEITKGSDSPIIRTGMGGFNVVVDFYGCKDDKCTSIQFYCVFSKSSKFDLEYASRWNNAKRYLKAYIDKDNDLILSMDVPLAGGVSRAFVRENIRLFESMLAVFEKF